MISYIKKLLKLYMLSCYNTKKQEKRRVSKLYKAIDIARYIVNYANDNNMIISNLKLQKILYFVQLEFLLNKNTPCFEDNIEAWDFGPVVPSVYHEFKKYGAFCIPRVSFVYDTSQGWFNLKQVSFKISIPSDEKEIIEDVVRVCDKYTPGQLVEITHNQLPWRNAYNSGMNNVITVQSMIKFLNGLSED